MTILPPVNLEAEGWAEKWPPGKYNFIISTAQSETVRNKIGSISLNRRIGQEAEAEQDLCEGAGKSRNFIH